MKISDIIRKFSAVILSFLMILTIVQSNAMTIMAEDTKISGKDLVLYPVPRNINFQDDWYQLDNGNINSDDYSLKAVNKIVDDAQQYLGVTLNKSDQSPVIVLEKDESLNEQGYSLTINQDGVQIKYKDEPGSYYAAVTLFQIMFQSGNNLPYLEIINDHPDFKYRGFMVDISRNRMPKVETLKKVIDIGENLKMNQLFLYFESFNYAYSYDNGSMWKGTDVLTPEKAREVNDYALSKGIEVIPVQNSFGHSYAWVNRYPDLGDKVGSDVLNIFNPETQKMLDSVYDDLAKGFTTDKLVICGDETFNIDPVNGNAAKGWKEKFPDRGEPTASDLYLDSMDIINDIAGKDNNRQVMYWADMVIGHNAYDQAKNIMDNAIIMDWGYTETYDFESHAKIFEEKEMPFYVCPGDNSWSTIAGNTTKTQLNAEHAALAGKNHKAIGYMMTNWGDYGHYQNIVTQYPAIAYAGGLSWCYDKNLTIDNEEMSYDAFLNTFVYQDSTGTISQAFSEFANFTTRYGIGGFNESYLATSWTEGANSYTHLDLLISAQTDANTMDQKRDNAIEDMKNISIEADNFLKVLSESNIQCDDSDLVYMEFENTAKQVKVATDFVSMRLRLYNLNGVTQITNEVEEAEQALKNLNYFNEMIEQFKTIWKERDEVHLLDSTINQISTPAVFYNGLIGLENIYKPISSDNLFIITPETMNSLNAEDFVQGANWATAGNKEPSLIHIYLGNDSKETVKDALDKGLFRLEDNIIGAEGKVFVADTKVANDNNLNHTNGMFPFLYFPAILPNDGVYEISAKLKYKNGSPVDGSTILVNGTMIPNSGGQIIIENPGEGNGVAEFSEPDENGWVTLKYTFESGKGRAVSVDFKPFGSASANGDSLYINNLVMRKIKDIFEDVTISSGHSSYNTISLGDIFIVPNAKSSGKEAITINMILPDGSKKEVRMKDQVKAEDEGIYRLIYDSSEAKEPLIILFEVRNHLDNILKIDDENANGFFETNPNGGIPLFNPYSDEYNSFNNDGNIITWGEGAENGPGDYVELLQNVEGGTGKVIHAFTHNLKGSHIPLINFAAEVESGKTYLISSKLKLNRVNMTGFDYAALRFGWLPFSNQNKDNSSEELGFGKTEFTLSNFLSPEELAKLSAGQWFNFSTKITIPSNCSQGNQLLPTTAIRFWYSLSALPADDMQYDLLIDNVSVIEIKNIISVENQSDILVGLGVDKKDLDLPQTVEVTLEDGTTILRPVVWDYSNDYNKSAPGSYVFTGEVIGSETVLNADSLEAKITVIVKEHQHNVVSFAAKAPSCTADGNIAYWYCSVCDKYFKNEGLTEEITEEETIIKATGHNYTTPTWSWNEDNSKAEATFICLNDETHKEVLEAKVTSVTEDPTVDKEGKITYTATVTFEGKEYTDAKEVTLAKLPVVTSGNNSSWNTNSSEGLTFVSDALYKDFIKVLVDNKEVDSKYYTIKEGSTIVTLSKDYLSTLKEGTHTLSIVSTNGTAETTFTIVKSDVTIPDTGNTVSIDYLLPATIIMASGIAIIYGLKKRRRS